MLWLIPLMSLNLLRVVLVTTNNDRYIPAVMKELFIPLLIISQVSIYYIPMPKAAPPKIEIEIVKAFPIKE